jgi:hypothetical protein
MPVMLLADVRAAIQQAAPIAERRPVRHGAALAAPPGVLTA